MELADPPPLPDLLALRWAIEACMRSRISGGMLFIICCICCIWSGDIPCIPWGLMPWGAVPDDASDAECCVVAESCAGVEFCAASAASFFFASAASMARITLLLTPAWFKRLQAGGGKIELRVIGGDGGGNRAFRHSRLNHFYNVGVGQRIFLLGGQGGYGKKNRDETAIRA